MPEPTQAQIHVDAPLSDIAIGYKSENFIADKVLKVVEVDKQSDKYFKWTKGFWLRNSVEKRAGGDTYPEGRLEVSAESFYCDIYHLGFPIADEDKATQDAAIELEVTGAEWIANQFLLNREITIVSDIFTTGKWATDVVGTTNFTKWSDFENSDPMTDLITGVQTIQKSTGAKANTLVIGREVLDKLTEHPLLLDKYKHTGIGILDTEEVRKALKVDQLLVGESVYESTEEGASSATRAYVWGKNALLCHVPTSPGKRIPACGYTFVWRMPDAGGYTVSIRNAREDNRDRDLLKGKHAFDHKITSTDLGYFFSNCVA